MRDVKKMEEAKKMATQLTNFVNSFGVDSDTFAKTICMEHRTLQQSVMRLFMATIKEFSEQKYYDARNEASVMLARKIMEAVGDDCMLPMV